MLDITNEEYCKQLERRVAELEKENAELRAQLGISDTKTTAVEPLQDTAEESIMRFTSHDIAGQLMDTVL